MIDGLDDAQWATPSVCAGWDIKTVAAHLVSVFADSFWMFKDKDQRGAEVGSFLSNMIMVGGLLALVAAAL